MPDMTLNRNYTLVSFAGRVINFEKNKPVYVPPQCVKEALAIGAQGVDEKLDILDPEAKEETAYTLDERLELIKATFPELEAANERESFTAQGVPTVGAIEAITGFDVNAKERDAAWTAYVQTKGTE
jgi:hypothetical protein